MPYTKVQFNVYLQRRFKTHIEEVVSAEESDVDSNSDAMTILIAYAQKYWTQDDWNTQAQNMKMFGEEGLVKI